MSAPIVAHFTLPAVVARIFIVSPTVRVISVVNRLLNLANGVVDNIGLGRNGGQRENSLFVATPAQDPQVMAAKAVEIGYDILQGKPAPKELVLIPVTMIDKNNVGNYKGWTVK
ncbi:periplasmic ribose-binding protein of ABC transport system [Shigella dysenteriae]|nr:periplasmic ribose-binding protein of ABC transport system [Shigella dysenteriae]